MTEQELREKLAELPILTVVLLSQGFTSRLAKEDIDRILNLIKEAGYVKLAEDQRLPYVQLRLSLEQADVLLKEGWRKVKVE